MELKVKKGHGADSNFGVVTCDASDTAEIIEARIRFALASGELDSTVPNLGSGYRHWTMWTNMTATGDGWYSGTPLKPQDVYAIAVVEDTVEVRKEGKERKHDRESARENKRESERERAREAGEREQERDRRERQERENKRERERQGEEQEKEQERTRERTREREQERAQERESRRKIVP